MKKSNRKIKLDTKKSEKRDQYTVVLEDLRSHFKAFGEGLSGVREEMKERFTGIESRLDTHSETLGQILIDVAEIKNNLTQKIDRVEFARLEKRVIQLERRNNR